MSGAMEATLEAAINIVVVEVLRDSAAKERPTTERTLSVRGKSLAEGIGRLAARLSTTWGEGTQSPEHWIALVERKLLDEGSQHGKKDKGRT